MKVNVKVNVKVKVKVAALVAVTFAAACGDRAGAASEVVALSEAQVLSAPTRVGAAPMFAVSHAGDEAAAWVSAPDGGTDGRLYVSIGGAPPVELRDSLGPIEAHGEAPPKLGYGGDGSLNAIYVVAKDVGERFPRASLRFVRSTDGGRTWTSPVVVTVGSQFGSHNFHALHVAPNGTIYVSWLGAGSSERTNGKSAAWITRSTDAGVTWSKAVRVDIGEACPCCRTALATGADGMLLMAWRTVMPGNVRDIVVARSSDQGAAWSTPVRVHADDWVFEGCPHAGPAMQVDSAGRVHIAWWTGKEGPNTAGTFYARSVDGGRTFSAPTPMGVASFSRPSHAQLALDGRGRVAVVWDDGTIETPAVMLRVSRDHGESFGEAQRLSAAGQAATFPVATLADSTLIVAWSEKSEHSAHADAKAEPDMKDPNARKGLHRVGDAQVVVRRATIH